MVAVEALEAEDASLDSVRASKHDDEATGFKQPARLIGAAPKLVVGAHCRGSRRRVDHRTAIERFELGALLGDRVAVGTPGGGGYGDPAERDPRLCQADILNGMAEIAS